MNQQTHQLNAAQEMLLRSALTSAFAGESHPTITLFDPSDQSQNMMPLENDDSKTIEENINKIIHKLDETKCSISIDINEKETIYTISKKSISREVRQKQPKVLKSAEWAVGKAVHLSPTEDAPLLQAIGLMTPEGEIRAPMRKKFKQVNHFIDLLLPILNKHYFKQSKRKSFTIIDCGCGKSYLSFVLFWYITRVMKKHARFFGVDTSAEVIKQCQDRAQRLDLDTMHFQQSTIMEAKLPKAIDLLVSLHACDTATDEAIVRGIAGGAKHIAVVPCCQHELAKQIETVPFYPLKKHGIFKNRFADLLTDMTRSLFLEAHNYTVTAGEFVSPEESPKNLMLKASWGNPAHRKMAQAYEAFKTHYQIYPSIDMLMSEINEES